MYADPAAPHLGGYIKGGDPLSFYPEMWQRLIESQHVGSVLDIGCGEGHSLAWFRSQGCEVLGLEGVPQDDKDIVQHDFAEAMWFAEQRYDLGWCCEFVEHVEERHIGNFLPAFMACDLLLMTHAIPGQGGHHHVNCQDSDYWIRVVSALGFTFDHDLTLRTRRLVEQGYYAWSGLAFRFTG